MSERSGQCYEFDSFRLDARRRSLSRGGLQVPLAPKVFETLLALVRNSGREVTKKELIERIWPDSFVEECNLAQNISALRKALGEEKNKNQYIITVPGRGYCFIARVRECVVEDGQRPEGATSHLNGDEKAATSIAVLPFKPVTPDESTLLLGVGLADSIIMKLSRREEIAVRPITAALRYSNSRKGPLAIGRELNVELVLDGIYQRDGDRLRVTANLFRSKDWATIWAAQFEEDFSNIFAVQDSISEQVVRVLAAKLGGEEPEQPRESRTHNKAQTTTSFASARRRA